MEHKRTGFEIPPGAVAVLRGRSWRGMLVSGRWLGPDASGAGTEPGVTVANPE